MKNFLLGSILLCLLGACTPLHPGRFTEYRAMPPPLFPHPVVQTDSAALLFKAGISFYGKYFSGLLLFKKTGNDTIRVVFSGETGVTFFDFEFSGENFRVVKCMEIMNREALINTFRNDLTMMLMAGLNTANVQWLIYGKQEKKVMKFSKGKDFFFYYLEENGSDIVRIERTSKRYKKVIIKIEQPVPNGRYHIFIRHKDVNLKMDLKLIPRSNADE